VQSTLHLVKKSPSLGQIKNVAENKEFEQTKHKFVFYKRARIRQGRGDTRARVEACERFDGEDRFQAGIDQKSLRPTWMADL
jgi:hypothetical protein